MCAIAGVYDLTDAAREPERAVLKRMADAMRHRGPDGEGYFVAPGVGLAHRRLAIIDVAGGAQPFQPGSETGALTFNGEIYNFPDLTAQLKARGVEFQTRSDTEALAEGLALDGDGFIHNLRGMFAFGYWRAGDRTLVLARDRLGEKPLYYARTQDDFLVFASEVDGILASGLVDDDLDPEAFADYALYGYVPDPKSVYRRIRKLPPGSLLRASPGGEPQIVRYWRPVFAASDALDFDSAAERLREMIDAAVKAQMIADVPLGAFLSGGVDSGGVVASMAATGRQVRTVTIGFDDKAHDERNEARLIAERYGAAHEERVAALDAAALIDRIAEVYGEPFADSSALPTYLVCETAREHVAVALSGDGGDEVFAGYRRYPLFLSEAKMRAILPYFVRRPIFGVAGAIYPKLDFAPRALRAKTTLQSISETNARAYARTVAATLPDRANAMLAEDLKDRLGGYDPRSVIEDAFAKAPDTDILSRAQFVDLRTWLPGRMLVKVDRASMAHSLEVRPPLLDHRLVEWAGMLPAAFKLDDGTGKRVLKAAFAPRLPETTLAARKRGFGSPLQSWLRERDGPQTRLEDSAAWREAGLFDVKTVRKMIKAHQSGASDYSQEIWTVIMADAFLRRRATRSVQS